MLDSWRTEIQGPKNSHNCDEITELPVKGHGVHRGEPCYGARHVSVPQLATEWICDISI
jgi:hypothetical protein